jgi:adenine-specific DNA methylase
LLKVLVLRFFIATLSMKDVSHEGKSPGQFLPDSLLELPAPGARIETMEERDFFNETVEDRTHTISCPRCGQAAEYKVSWVVRRKKAQLPRHADERDRARFAKAQSYMVRRDDKLTCANIRCRKPFEITSLQSLAFLMD